MQRQSVSSSNIASVGYDEGTMEVEFNNGSIYQYFDVPERVYDELLSAPSVGSYLAANVKGTYRYSKV